MRVYNDALPKNILRGKVPTATLWDGQVGFAFQAKTGGTVFTDFSAAANNATANDVTLFDATAQLNDAFYFGENFSTSGVFNTLLINVGTVMSGFTGTMVWEYWNGAWVALTVTDATSFFTVSGSNYVTFTTPGDMAATTVNAQNRYWIRVRISAFTAMTVKPLATQIWLGRYPTSLTNITDGDNTTATGQGTVLLGAAGAMGYLSFDLGSSKLCMITGRFGLWSSANTITMTFEPSESAVPTGLMQNTINSQIAASESVEDTLSKTGKGRYIHVRFRLSAAATAFMKGYEMRAYELGA